VVRAVSLLRVRLFPEFWQSSNAVALIYYLCWGLPLVAGVLLLRRARDPGSDPVLAAWLWSAIALCLVTDALILRDPIEARVGGMAGAPAILAAWLGARAWTTGATRTIRSLTRLCTALVVVLIACSLSAAGDWQRRALPQLVNPGMVVDNARVMATSPPPESQLPSGGLAGLVHYVRTCTTPQDRVFTSWFVPELYFFSQRGFAGGMTVVFGRHWSQPRFQRRSIAWLSKQQVPIAVLENRSYETFVDEYPLIADYLREHYSLAGIRDFGNLGAPAGYRVLVTTARPPRGMDPLTSLPCFQ
jgi:hypothetical protein